MQTFLVSSVEETAWTLDPLMPEIYRSSGRATKQVVEASQLIDCHIRKMFQWDAGRRKDGSPKVVPWSNHPAALLWDGHLDALCNYFNTFYEVVVLKRKLWNPNNKLAARYPIRRLPSCAGLRWIDPHAELPPLMRTEAFQSAHRAALLAKFPLWYSQFGWTEEPKVNYIWSFVENNAT